MWNNQLFIWGFFSMNDSFLRLWITTPRPNWEIHMDWENDV